MTTSIKVTVNGRYRATVKQDGKANVVIEQGPDGKAGEHTFNLPSNPAASNFAVYEEALPSEAEQRKIDAQQAEAKNAAEEAERNAADPARASKADAAKAEANSNQKAMQSQQASKVEHGRHPGAHSRHGHAAAKK